MSKTPKIKMQRFAISASEPKTAVVAIIEALNHDHAFQRFNKLRPILQRQLAAKSVWKIEELVQKHPIHYPLFLDKFFDILDASDALKH